MPILINYQICDSSEDCPPIKWCTSAALSFDGDQQKIKYDLAKCTSCGTCVNWCGPGAIYFVENQEDLDFLRREMGIE